MKMLAWVRRNWTLPASIILISGLAYAATPSAAQAQVATSSMLYPTQAPTTTVASLPACSTSLRGVTYIVTNALLPVALANVAAGGAVVVKVFCNGTNWIVG